MQNTATAEPFDCSGRCRPVPLVPRLDRPSRRRDNDADRHRFLPWRTGSEPTMAHLLLIDDDPALIPEQVRQAFPAPAHRVEVAGTGAEGLERVRAGPPDVILLDLRLPDQSGLEVYQQIRRIDARIPVIFVTMAKDGRRGHRGDEAGRLRLPVQAARPAPAAARGRRGAGSGPADARAGRGRRDGARPRRGRRHRRLLPGHARGLQGHRPRRRPRTSRC